MDLEQNPTKRNTFPGKIDRYSIVKELGRGGMGCVYKAFDPHTNRFVALKTILADSKNQMQRFAREAKAMAKIDHPNIVKVYFIGQENTSPFFIMDYIEGISLKEFLESASLNVRLFSQIMVKIAEAIAYAHKQGIIHRDLKPGNIMLDKNQEPYVMDFGIAALTTVDKSLTKTGTILGTPQYMSPQQAKGEKTNQQTDVYALGAIFYEMLCGKPLVEGKSATDILFKVIHEEPTLLRQRENKLALDLETICHKAVAKEIDKRYQNAQEFSNEIQRFLDGKFIEAKTTSLWQKCANKIYKNKLIVAIALGAILLLFAQALIFEKQQKSKAYGYLDKIKKLQQKFVSLKVVDRQMQMYIRISSLLEKALEISPHSSTIKQKLIKTREEMGLLAQKQKNYLLSFILFNRCKNLGYAKADALLKNLEEEKSQIKRNHKKFISHAMGKVSQKTPQALFDRYVFNIVKMKNSYIVAMLAPYLKSKNKWQRLLAIKTLGKMGNAYTKFQNKDAVQWLLELLEKFNTKKALHSNQEEAKEIIWALGWLKDQRSNDLVYNTRWLAGDESLLKIKTAIPYSWIPLSKNKTLKTSEQFNKRGLMKRAKRDYQGAIADFNQAIALNSKFSQIYNNRGLVYQDIKQLSKAIADYTQAIILNPKFSQAYHNRGSTYWELKEYSKAITDHTQAIILTPKYSLAYNGRGNAYQNAGKYSKAIADYSKAIYLNPESSLAYNNRGNTYLEVKKFSKAIDDFSKAMEFNPLYFGVYNNRGNVYKTIGAYSKAIADFSKAIILNPKNPAAYSNRGRVYQKIRAYSKALEDHTRAIAFNPKDAGVYNNRALVYQDIKQYSKAMLDYNKAIALDPDYALTYSNRALAYKDMGKYLEAIEDFTKVLALNPKNLGAYSNRGGIYQYMGKHIKAIADYNQAIAIDPMYSLAYSNRGSAYLNIKQYSKAMTDFTKALSLNPKDSFVYYNRGIIYQNRKEYIKAIADFTQAIALNLKDALVYNNRAQAYLNIKAYSKAIDDYSKAIVLTPKDLVLYSNRALAYLKAKEYSKAIADYDKIVAFNPRVSLVYYSRGIVYQKMKEYSKAIADFTQAIALNPKSLAYGDRGHLYHIRGNKAKAASDYLQIIKLSKNIAKVNPYFYLLLMGLKRQQGEKGQIKTLDQYAKKQTSYGWTLVKYYIEIISEQTLFKITKRLAKEKKGRFCEFYYYVGINHLAQGKKRKAKRYFQKCIKYKVENYLEPEFARAELKKLRNKK